MSQQVYFEVEISKFSTPDSARSAAFRHKKKAIEKGWTNVETITKKDAGIVRVIGTAPSSSPPESTPAPTTRQVAKKKAPSKEPLVDLPPKIEKPTKPTKNGSFLHKGRPGPRPVGRTSKVGIEQTWGLLFEREAGKKDVTKRLTNDQIADEMRSEFPGRTSKVFDRVSDVRAKWARGEFGYQKKAAKK